MTLTEKQQLLASHVATFRTWPYERLAREIGRTARALEYLSYVEGTWVDGTEWWIKVDVFWDGGKSRNIRVTGEMKTFNPNTGEFVGPIHTSNAADDFIMAPDGTFIGE